MGTNALNPAAVFIATYFAQVVQCAIIAFVIHSLYTTYHRNFLLQWSRSWWALSAASLAGGAGLILSLGPMPPLHPTRVLATGAALVAGYWQVAWLLFGMREVTTGRTVRRSRSRLILIFFAVLAIVCTLLFPSTGPGAAPSRLFARVGLHALVAAVAFGVSAVAVWRIGKFGSRAGARLVGASFLAYGLGQLHYFAITVVYLADLPYPGYARFLGMGDILLQTAIGISMVYWFLAEERVRVLEASDKIQQLSLHDPLTNLPNRRLFMDRMEQVLAVAFRSKEKAAILYLNLDRFMAVNNSLGHAGADEIFRAVAERVRGHVQEGDTVARFGGDTFGILKTGLKSREEAEAFASHLLEEIRQPFPLQGRNIHISSSAGICLFPDHGLYPEDLVNMASMAMRRAKEEGRDRYAVFDPERDRAFEDLVSLEGDLRRGMAEGEFVLHYQPILSLEAGEVVRVEALLRWAHPVRGLLLPRDFLSLAENVGLADELNLFAVREAARQGQTWHLEGFSAGVAVNILARLFQHPDFEETIRDILESSHLPPERLHLEITETVAMQNPEASREVLHRLKALGIRISIDDFGTGYSSLSYLRSFPVDVLKIDQSFIGALPFDHQTASIVEAIIAMAHSLKLKLTAEGVETEAQHAQLVRGGCDEVQGFLFARPMPPVECARFLEKHRGEAASKARHNASAH